MKEHMNKTIDNNLDKLSEKIQEIRKSSNWEEAEDLIVDSLYEIRATLKVLQKLTNEKGK